MSTSDEQSKGKPAGFDCPGCGKPAELVLVGGVQAFCGNDDCAVFSWNPTKTLEELADNISRIGPGLSFTCPRCARTSFNPNDVREGYCGACHDFTGKQP